MTEIAGLDERTRTELEAAAFRTLVEHLRAHPEVQNIDLMNLAGFCRNCLSKWYRAAAERQRPRRCPTTRRARSSTACPMTTGRRSTRPRQRRSSRRSSPRAAQSHTERVPGHLRTTILVAGPAEAGDLMMVMARSATAEG